MSAPLELRNQSKQRELLSLVVPMFNESDVIPKFFEQVIPVLAKLDLRSEIVIVDDGSTDDTAELVLKFRTADANIRLVKLSRNFGKEAAVTAGLEHAKGSAVIVIDADLQDPPGHIEQMIERWRSGYDVVLMRRRSRAGEGRFKRWSAYCFYRLLNKSSKIEIPVDTGDFRLMSRRAVTALLKLSERNRYMKGLFAWIGMPTSVIEYDRAERCAGETKWNYSGLVSLAFEAMTSFSTAPLRWATAVGLIAATVGAVFGFWIVFKAMFFGDPTTGYPSLIAVMCFLGGIQLVGIGIVGEYVGKTYIESKRRPIYLAHDVIEVVTQATESCDSRDMLEARSAKAG